MANRLAPGETLVGIPGRCWCAWGAGRLILSGILRTQETEVVAAYRRAGFRIERIVRKGKWIALLATRAEA